MREGSQKRWQARLYDMKRDWLQFIAEADARGNLEEAKHYRAQFARIIAMLEDVGADPDGSPPRQTHA